MGIIAKILEVSSYRLKNDRETSERNTKL